MMPISARVMNDRGSDLSSLAAVVIAHGDGDDEVSGMAVMVTAGERVVNLVYECQCFERRAVSPTDGHGVRVSDSRVGEGAHESHLAVWGLALLCWLAQHE